MTRFLRESLGDSLGPRERFAFPQVARHLVLVGLPANSHAEEEI